ncbi:response regulator [Mucilaginibacter arboris]|uniref:Response regulator n=1 Tax=Mucilaginibacter arboris TaxID=2682090 RepID=A0A7K1SWX5_9SPHI|nr:response regulator [Mucilaginibacter arboris]MVN21819.1 response regulator [Mucilaginibacter arboris]
MPQPKYELCLLIDDNYIDNMINRKIIENEFFAKKVIVKESAEEALEDLKKGQYKPDVIFLDVRMPQMNAFEFLKEYEKSKPEGNSPMIYILTSSLDPFDHRKVMESPFVTQFLYKPLTHQKLEEINL